MCLYQKTKRQYSSKTDEIHQKVELTDILYTHKLIIREMHNLKDNFNIRRGLKGIIAIEQ